MGRPIPAPASFIIGEQLRLMDIFNLFHAFQFPDKDALNKMVHSVSAVETNSLLLCMKRPLQLKSHSVQPELVGQALFVS